MEPQRPIVDRKVLEFVLAHSFSDATVSRSRVGSMRRQTVQYDRLDLSGRKGMAQPAQIGLEPPHHDGLEAVGIRMLLNEHEMIRRDHRRIHLVGIDGAHFYRVDNIEKAAAIPHDEFSNLISHPPEVYRQAAHAPITL
jgi:hypothetical protein